MRKGISLVALVITIVVLIILSGTIILTAMDDSIFGRAETARDERNKQEVYSAVQREVLNVQASKIGLAVSAEFATELQTQILKNHKASKATATYNSSSDNIAITFDANGKTYNLILDNKYRLTMDEEASGTEDNQFVIDLKTAMQNNLDSTSGVYDLVGIQRELQDEYTNSKYTYFVQRTVGGKTINFPTGTGDVVNNGDLDGVAITSDGWSAKFENEGITRVIENGTLKNNFENEEVPYMLEADAAVLYEYDSSNIIKYKGRESVVTVPRVIMADSWSEMETIKQYAFSETEVNRVDLVRSMLDMTQAEYRSSDAINTLLAIGEGITDGDTSKSVYYKDGMTNDEYVAAVIKNVYNGYTYIEEGVDDDGGTINTIFTYTDEDGNFIQRPCDKEITKVIIPISRSEISIEANAFYAYRYENEVLKTIEINSLVDTINSQAFKGCTALTDIYMPLYTMEEVQALANYSTNKWGAPNATIHCKDGNL